MTRSILTFAAIVALGLGAAACAGKSETSESAAPAADQAAAAPDAAQAPAADQAAAAPEAAAPTAPDANAPAPEMSAPATEMAAAEPAPPPAQTERQMLRDVRSGAHVSRVCAKVDTVSVTGFKQCVADAVSQAEAKGSGTDAYRLGADYRAWAFLGEHAAEMREKGLEWSKQYLQAYAERETFRKSAADLLDRTGLKEPQVCNAIDVGKCPE
jgi:hypothetical protein